MLIPQDEEDHQGAADQGVDGADQVEVADVEAVGIVVVVAEAEVEVNEQYPHARKAGSSRSHHETLEGLKHIAVVIMQTATRDRVGGLLIRVESSECGVPSSKHGYRCVPQPFHSKD